MRLRVIKFLISMDVRLKTTENLFNLEASRAHKISELELDFFQFLSFFDM